MISRRGLLGTLGALVLAPKSLLGKAKSQVGHNGGFTSTARRSTVPGPELRIIRYYYNQTLVNKRIQLRPGDHFLRCRFINCTVYDAIQRGEDCALIDCYVTGMKQGETQWHVICEKYPTDIEFDYVAPNNLIGPTTSISRFHDEELEREGIIIS